MARVFLIDSNLAILQTLKIHLSAEHSVECRSPAHALEYFDQFNPDIIFFCSEELLEKPEILKSLAVKCPSLMSLKTSAGHHMQTLLNAGVTDWLIEPLSFDQLNWKIKFLTCKDTDEEQNFKLATLHVKPREHHVLKNGKTITLTPTQIRLLIAFHSFPDRVLTRDWLRFKIWNGEPISLRSIDAHISKLKKLLPELESHLESIYGKGYLWKSLASSSENEAL